MVHWMSVFSDKIINRSKMVLSSDELLYLILTFALSSVIYFIISENVSCRGKYVGGPDSLSHLEALWIPLADLGC